MPPVPHKSAATPNMSRKQQHLRQENPSRWYEQINSYLVAELEKLGIWNKDIRHEIIRSDGSIQNIIAIPDWIKKLFRAYEISQKSSSIKHATERPTLIKANL